MWKTLSIVALLSAAPMQASVPDGGEEATVFVEAGRGSAFIHILVNNHRRIGNVVIEVRDIHGRTLYKEEGKAMTDELVRRLDKGMFPRGEHLLAISARDLSITQRFTIE